MKHDAVRDGRDLMANDGDGEPDPCDGKTWWGMGCHCWGPYFGKMQFQGRVITCPFHGINLFAVPDHPNYRYPQERTGDSTV